jgi:hypothetical protein
MIRTGSGEDERGNPGGVNSRPDETGHSMTVGPMAAVSGEVEAGKVARREVVPVGERRQTVARDPPAFGTADALESADVHAEPTGEPANETGVAIGRPVTSADMVAGLVVAGREADAASAGANSAATESVALPAGTDQDAVEVASATATLAAPPQEDSGRVESGSPPKPTRISKPMLAAAAIAGVVLTAMPFAVSSLVSHGSPGKTHSEAAAFNGGGGSSSGFVPRAATGIPVPSTGTAAPPAENPTAQVGPTTTAMTTTAAPVGATSVVVRAGRVFLPGDSVQTNRRRLTMQNDGNLVIYDENNHPLWSSGTGGRGYMALFQSDGNFVVYTRDNQPVWGAQPGTVGNSGATLVLQGDGNVTIVYGGRVVWASNTAR